jgi:N-acyl-D-aspartate/D-glutamate deacylase
VLQLVSDFFPDGAAELAMVRRIVERSGRPLSFSLVQSPKSPGGWKAMLAGLSAAVDAGLPMKAQVCGRPVGVLFGLELTLNPFSQNPVFAEIKDKALRDKVAALSDPDFRARLLAHDLDATGPFAGSALRAWDNLSLWRRPRLRADGRRYRRGHRRRDRRPPAEVALDAMLENGGRGMLYHPFLNYADGSLDPSFRMLTHRDTVPGLSDGGAHVGMICDGSFPTSNLTHWTRDRARGRASAETMIARQTRDTAAAVGLLDRGLIAPGYRADLNVIDYEGLRLRRPRRLRPAGGRTAADAESPWLCRDPRRRRGHAARRRTDRRPARTPGARGALGPSRPGGGVAATRRSPRPASARQTDQPRSSTAAVRCWTSRDSPG